MVKELCGEHEGGWLSVTYLRILIDLVGCW